MAQEATFDPAPIQGIIDQAIPHVRELGVELVSIAKRTATMKLAYQERLVGNPETGVLHGGVITTLVDTVCGMAVYAALPKLVPIATLDLRIDYLRPATPHQDLVARAECYKTTRNVAFVRALAYHDDPDDPIANCVAAFMIETAGGAPIPPGTRAP